MTTTPANSIDRVDPMPAPLLGMWLFLAGEAMFFAGLLSAYIVLQSVPGERALFVRSARVVSLPLTITAGALLATAMLALLRRGLGTPHLTVVAGLAVAFLVVQLSAAWHLWSRQTVVTATDVYDGAVGRRRGDVTIAGLRVALPPSFDAARTLPADFARTGTAGQFTVPALDVRFDVNYGPSRNNYFACYFLVNCAHALHVVGGLAALAWLIVRTRRGLATAAQIRVVSLYWQFVNGVGILSLILLALG